jgi:hypothetical protein
MKILFGLMFLFVMGCGTDVHVGSGVEVCTGTECGDGHNTDDHSTETTTDTT